MKKIIGLTGLLMIIVPASAHLSQFIECHVIIKAIFVAGYFVLALLLLFVWAKSE